MSFYQDITPKFKARVLKETNQTYNTYDANVNSDMMVENLVGYDIEYDEDAIKNSLLNIFIIQRGEVPGKPAFGNPLNISLFDLFDFFTVTDMKTAVENVIAKYEPRVRLQGVDIIQAPEYNRIIININYSYIVNNTINYDSLNIPYSHNSISYLGGRIKPPEVKSNSTDCIKG